MTDGSQTLGEAFARALGAKDFDAIAGLLHPDVTFRGLTPNRSWEATGPQAVIDDVLTHWLEESDEVEEVTSVKTGAFADREHVEYSFRGHNDDGQFVVEQQAYFTAEDGRINWMRVLCTGFRPA